MKIPHFITFTGVDDDTDLSEIARLNRLFPGLIEWGVLHGGLAPQREAGPDMLTCLGDFAMTVPVRLALHLCGRKSLAFLKGEWTGLPNFHPFARIQINALTRSYLALPDMEDLAKSAGRPLIVQVRRAFPYVFSPKVHFLFDESGGRGEEAQAWPVPGGNFEANHIRPGGGSIVVGFAGGIRPENVRRVLQDIPAPAGSFWIDMESGVRDQMDRFDLGKVEQVLRAVYAFSVTYKVKGFEGEHTAGPYSPEDIESHRQDIAGYEDVYDVKVIPVAAPPATTEGPCS